MKNSKLSYIRFIIYLIIYGAFFVIPTEIVEKRSLCLFYNLLGVRCLGCGLTRAFSNMLRGNILRAIEFNKLVVVFFPIFIILSLNDVSIIFKRIFYYKDNYNKESIVEKLLNKIYKNNRCS